MEEKTNCLNSDLLIFSQEERKRKKNSEAIVASHLRPGTFPPMRVRSLKLAMGRAADAA